MSKIKKPFYPIDEKNRNDIIALIEKCKEIDIDNLDFELYNVGSFHLREYKTYWELIVKVLGKGLDIYKINSGGFIYITSEDEGGEHG